MFLQACVILFTGGSAWSRGVPGPGRGLVRGGGCLVPGGYLLWGCLVLGGCLVEPPGTATAAGGTHPIGMHSCYLLNARDISHI